MVKSYKNVQILKFCNCKEAMMVMLTVSFLNVDSRAVSVSFRVLCRIAGGPYFVKLQDS